MIQMLRRELVDGWRSFRFPGLALVVMFFALLDPPSTKYMAEILKMFAGDLVIQAPPPHPADAFASFLGDVNGMALLVLIVISMGLVAREKENGVAAWVLTRPVSRDNYLLGKLAASVVAFFGAVLAGGVLCYLYTWSLLGRLELIPALVLTLGLGLYGSVVLAVTWSASALGKSPLVAGGWGLGSLFLLWIPSSILSLTAAGRFLPYSLVGQAGAVLRGVTPLADLIPAAMVSLALIAVVIVFTLTRFRALEIE